MTVDLLTPNEFSRPQLALEKVNAIVVHYTANPGTTAAQNRSYFEGLKDTGLTHASSHFIIGLDGEISSAFLQVSSAMLQMIGMLILFLSNAVYRMILANSMIPRTRVVFIYAHGFAADLILIHPLTLSDTMILQERTVQNIS